MVAAMPAPITLNRPGWERECRRTGLDTDAARATALGVNRTTISQVQNGRRAIGSGFIVAALTAFPDARFEDLFVVAPPSRSERAE